MMTHGIGLLLLSAVAGYWVLERASSQKGELKRVGRFLGGLVIAVSLIGVGCTVACLVSGMNGCTMGCGPMGKRAMGGYACPFTSKTKANPSPAASSMPSQTQKER